MNDDLAKRIAATAQDDQSDAAVRTWAQMVARYYLALRAEGMSEAESAAFMVRYINEIHRG